MSRFQLAVAGLLITVATVAGVVGLALSEPDDDVKRWLCAAAVTSAFVGALAWLVAWVLRARTTATMVASARRMAAAVHKSDDVASDARDAAKRWVQQVAPAQVEMLMRADAYTAAEQVRESLAEVAAALPIDGEQEGYAS